MKKSVILLAIAGCAVWSLDAVGTMKQSAELGYIGTTGNAQSQSLNAVYKNDYRYDEKTDMHIKADLFYGEKSGTKSDERYRLYYDVNSYYSDELFIYGEVSALRNVFSGYNQQYNLGMGLGSNIFKDAKQSLKGRAGLQYRRSNYTDQPHDNFHYLKGGMDYIYSFSATNEFAISWNIIDNVEKIKDYETVINFGLKMLIVDQLSFRAGLEVRYDNVPPAGKKKTDTTTTAGIVYNF